MTHSDDEFYVGYESVMPPGIGRAVRVLVAIASLLTLAVAAVVTTAQGPLAASSFAYGRTQAWSGYLVRMPAPALLVPGADGFTRHWLVARGKHGAEQALAGLREGWVEIRGTEIARDPWRMVEIASAAPGLPPADAPPTPAVETDTGRATTLRGEIVDSKCFLGAMNPGERTVHRDCAIRCLSGGVTPMFSYRDGAGMPQLAVIVDSRGAVPPEVTRNKVGRPLDLQGQLFMVGDVPVLRLDSSSGAW
jgi:hypothetical protein